MKTYSFFCSLITFLFLSASIYSQQSAGGIPMSFLEDISSLESVEIELMPDFQESWVADQEPNRPGRPYYFGYAYKVDLDVLSLGTWDTLGEQDLICRLRIKSTGAFSLNFILDRFHLTKGSSLFVYNSTKDHVLGAFTSELNNSEYRVFSTDLVAGDEVIFEYFQPSLDKPTSELNISRVIHAYENVISVQSGGLGTSGSCNNDVLCPVGDPWCVQRRAVNMILLDDNKAICSACMLNNETEDLTPYNLTAFHCADTDGDGDISTHEESEMRTWLFRFQYWRPECGSMSPPSPYISFTGADMRAAHFGTDMLLLELLTQPTPGTGVLFAGWDRVLNSPPPSGSGIHHPSGDAMKISLFNVTPTMVAIPQDLYEVTFFTGVTEGGSSGSPLFNDDRQVIGQLLGTYTANPISCSNPSAPALYGRLDISWNGGGTAATRLRDWLDPNNTGIMEVGAISPEAFYVNKTLTGTREFANLEDIHIEGNVVVAGGSSLCPPNTTLFTTQPGSNSTFLGRTIKVYSGTQFQAGSNARLIATDYECGMNYDPGDYVIPCGAAVTPKRGVPSYDYYDDSKEEEENEVRVYPNPSSGLLTVESVYELQRLEVWSINGRILHQQSQSNSNKVEVDLGAMPEGIYLIRMYTPIGVKTEKIIKSAR